MGYFPSASNLCSEHQVPGSSPPAETSIHNLSAWFAYGHLWHQKKLATVAGALNGMAQVGRMEQMETAAEAKAHRGPKATIRRELARIHTPATATGALWCDHGCLAWQPFRPGNIEGFSSLPLPPGQS